jgi:hypothetical protein
MHASVIRVGESYMSLLSIIMAGRTIYLGVVLRAKVVVPCRYYYFNTDSE